MCTTQQCMIVNETIHDEDDSSEESEDENLNEMQTYENNGEQNAQKDKLLTTNIEVKVENRKVEGLITYSTDQQIFKFKVNSGNNQELLGVNTDFSSYELKWTIDAIL